MCSTEEGMSLPEKLSRILSGPREKTSEFAEKQIISWTRFIFSLQWGINVKIRKGASLWPKRGMTRSWKISHGWIQLHFLIKKIKMNTYCIPWSVHRSSRDSLWPCCTLCSSLCTPRCDTWTSLDHYTESLQGGGRSRRKKNNLIQHLDVWVRIKTWKQGVQASCGCVMM